MADKDELLSVLRPVKQEHLLTFWDRLDAVQQKRLCEEIRSLDLPLIARLYAQPDGEGETRRFVERAGPPPAFRLGDAHNRVSPQTARRRGEEALLAGHVGAILVAGGQGTRLGYDGPKGTYPIGPVSRHSLFQILVEKVGERARRAGRSIPLYLMTSPVTSHAIAEFFEQHRRFGLPEEDLQLFVQGTMPAVDAATGKVLLEGPDRIALSPDGHGGMLAALVRHGALDDARRRGIRHLFYFQVDNPLVDVLDPEFLGYHILGESEMTTQVVRKQHPKERVGNVVRVDGRLKVIEYSELPDEVAERRQPDGSLACWAGSIAVHALERTFLEQLAAQAESLPFHHARKAVPYVDLSGQRVVPHQPNALKFERFIFDLMPAARNAIVVEVDPRRHFAPLKNASGQSQDTPEAVQEQIVALHTEWLNQAGVQVAPGVPVEIGPRYALTARDLAGRMAPGTRITQPTFFS